MEIIEQAYQVQYNQDTETVTLAGTLELAGVPEYAPIADLLDQIAERTPPQITLDVRELEFVNSSGITTLLQFAIKLRNLKTSKLVVLGRSAYTWQTKSLRNIQRFLKDSELIFE